MRIRRRSMPRLRMQPYDDLDLAIVLAPIAEQGLQHSVDTENHLGAGASEDQRCCTVVKSLEGFT